MTNDARSAIRILGSLRSDDGSGVVRMEDRFDTDINDLWGALTEPARLARWYGEIDGDLRPGGSFRFSIPNALAGTGRIDACEPPRRLMVTMYDADAQPGQPTETVTEAWLTADASQTILVIEERGLPLPMLPAYGAGVQMHVENLAAYLAGKDDRATEERWAELAPAYREMAAVLK